MTDARKNEIYLLNRGGILIKIQSSSRDKLKLANGGKFKTRM